MLTFSPSYGLMFMLHDFGYRGASSHESAEIGGAAHLVNFNGTDTLPAIQCVEKWYGGFGENFGYPMSVPATEHSIMTSLGAGGEREIVDRLLVEYPTGILSIVADSYNIYEFVDYIGHRKDEVLARDGVLVIRPDSISETHRTPAALVLWILEKLWHDFGGSETPTGYKTLDPHVRVLWGDGLEPETIEEILDAMYKGGWAAINIATFGMGGGLLQKVNRDTQRFAFKSSAQKRNGEWHDVYKQPLDTSKTSKKGRLRLVRDTTGAYITEREDDLVHDHIADHILEPVFENGELLRQQSFEEIRKNATYSL